MADTSHTNPKGEICPIVVAHPDPDLTLRPQIPTSHPDLTSRCSWSSIQSDGYSCSADVFLTATNGPHAIIKVFNSEGGNLGQALLKAFEL